MGNVNTFQSCSHRPPHVNARLTRLHLLASALPAARVPIKPLPTAEQEHFDRAAAAYRSTDASTSHIYFKDLKLLAVRGGPGRRRVVLQGGCRLALAYCARACMAYTPCKQQQQQQHAYMAERALMVCASQCGRSLAAAALLLWVAHQRTNLLPCHPSTLQLPLIDEHSTMWTARTSTAATAALATWRGWTRSPAHPTPRWTAWARVSERRGCCRVVEQAGLCRAGGMVGWSVPWWEAEAAGLCRLRLRAAAALFLRCSPIGLHV